MGAAFTPSVGISNATTTVAGAAWSTGGGRWRVKKSGN